MIEHTYIELWGLVLSDPLTFITDVMMAIVCFYCGHRLFYDFKYQYTKFAAIFFLFLGFSALLGGISHLLDIYFGKTPHLVAWMMQGISILFIELACLRLLVKGKFKYLLRAIVYAFFGVFVSQLFIIQHFNVVKINSAIGLIGFLVGIHVFKYFETKEKVYLKAPLAISLYLLPAIVHGFNLAVNPWINQNVISHIMLLPCFYLLYSGIKEVSELAIKKQIQLIRQSKHQ